MGVNSERAVSIPQITYDHIEDSSVKKDVSFYAEEPRGTVEGNTLERPPRSCVFNVDFNILQPELHSYI